MMMKECSWSMVAIQYLVVPMVGSFIGVEEVEFPGHGGVHGKDTDPAGLNRRKISLTRRTQ